MPNTVTPVNEATKALAQTSSEALLDAMVQLTHRIHGLELDGKPARAQILRQSRGMVRAELLTRIGADR